MFSQKILYTLGKCKFVSIVLAAQGNESFDF